MDGHLFYAFGEYTIHMYGKMKLISILLHFYLCSVWVYQLKRARCSQVKLFPLINVKFLMAGPCFIYL